MDLTDIVVGVLSMLGAGGGLAAFFGMLKHFRSQASVDRRIEADEEQSLAATLAKLNETLTDGVFKTVEAHALAMAQVQEQHANDMARERQHCDERLSAMGRRLDDLNARRAHDLKNFLSSMMALAQLAKVPADKAAELARAFQAPEAEAAD